MTKFRDAGAYEIAQDMDAEKAAKLGLAVVEVDPTSGLPTAWGRYKDAPKGSPLGVTIAEPEDTKVVGGGEVSAPAPAPGDGGPTNLDDPVVKTPPGVETIHADNAPPGVFDEDLPPVKADAKKKK